MRGSIVSRVINQLATSTDWGELDYLVIDMPPGTGDIQLTLSQNLVLTGAVIVTTPHPLSEGLALSTGAQTHITLSEHTEGLAFHGRSDAHHTQRGHYFA